MPVKERKSSSHSALFATPWVLTALDQSSAVSSEESHPPLKDSTTRKYSPPSDRFYLAVLLRAREPGTRRTSTNISSLQPTMHQETQWHSLESPTPRTEVIWLLIWRTQSEHCAAYLNICDISSHSYCSSRQLLSQLARVCLICNAWESNWKYQHSSIVFQ